MEFKTKPFLKKNQWFKFATRKLEAMATCCVGLHQDMIVGWFEPSHKLSNFRPKKCLQLCYGYATPVILNFMCQKLKTLKILI